MKGFDFVPIIGFLSIVFMISGRILQLKRVGIRAGSGRSERKKSSIFLYPFFLLILVVWLFEVIKPALQIPFSILPPELTYNLFDSVFPKLAGVVIVMFSLVLFKTTLSHFGNSLRFGFDKSNPGKLVTKGIFSYSRNPFFLSINLYFGGVAFIFPNLFLIGFTLLSIMGTHIFILKEEKIMSQMYGKEYEHYKKKVRRYF